jgi:hypothetical protein
LVLRMSSPILLLRYAQIFYDGFFGDTPKKWNEKAEEIPETHLIETADEHWLDQIR